MPSFTMRHVWFNGKGNGTVDFCLLLEASAL